MPPTRCFAKGAARPLLAFCQFTLGIFPGTKMGQGAVELDHLAITAPTLEIGVRWVEERLGVRLSPGGAHPMMGTHNRLLMTPGRMSGWAHGSCVCRIWTQHCAMRLQGAECRCLCRGVTWLGGWRFQ